MRLWHTPIFQALPLKICGLEVPPDQVFGAPPVQLP